MEDASEEFSLNETELGRLRELVDLSRGSLRFEVMFDGKPYRAMVDFVPSGFSVNLIDRNSRNLDQISFLYFAEGGFKFGLTADEISWIKAFLNGYQVPG